VPLAAPLIERSDDLVSIEQALADVQTGDGRCAFIAGPAGIGKTALLNEVRNIGRSRGFRLLEATGFELERSFPFSVVRQLYERVLEELDEAERSALAQGAGAVFDAAGNDSAGPDLSFQVLHGLYWLVAELAQASPLLIAVDDVQWSDGPSLRHLLYLSRRLEGLPVTPGSVEGTLMRAYAKLGISGRGAREALPEALGSLFAEA
jgi:predicted ATPase